MKVLFFNLLNWFDLVVCIHIPIDYVTVVAMKCTSYSYWLRYCGCYEVYNITKKSGQAQFYQIMKLRQFAPFFKWFSFSHLVGTVMKNGS